MDELSWANRGVRVEAMLRQVPGQDQVFKRGEEFMASAFEPRKYKQKLWWKEELGLVVVSQRLA
jgi:hypothetical protein